MADKNFGEIILKEAKGDGLVPSLIARHSQDAHCEEILALWNLAMTPKRRRRVFGDRDKYKKVKPFFRKLLFTESLYLFAFFSL